MTTSPSITPPPTPQPKTPLWKKLLRSLLLILIGTYAAFCVALYFAQDAMIFPGTQMGTNHEPKLLPRTQVLKLKFATGKTVEAWYIPAPNASKDHPAPLLVFFHGNGEFIDHHTSAVQQFNDMGWSFLLPEYRGYNRSDGTPSQSTILNDNAYFLRQVLSLPEVDAKHIVYYGRSLGGGVACDLTHARQPQGLILTSTFSSMVEMSKEFYVPFFIVKHPFYNDSVVQSFPGPIFIAHGSHDEGIPFSHAKTLNSLAKHPTFLELDCGHNDFPGSSPAAHEKYWAAVKTFLDKIKPTDSPLPRS
jgi:fermentation-respiration switch protein FrsA (DUF1100 family)